MGEWESGKENLLWAEQKELCREKRREGGRLPGVAPVFNGGRSVDFGQVRDVGREW